MLSNTDKHASQTSDSNIRWYIPPDQSTKTVAILLAMIFGGIAFVAVGLVARIFIPPTANASGVLTIIGIGLFLLVTRFFSSIILSFMVSQPAIKKIVVGGFIVVSIILVGTVAYLKLSPPTGRGREFRDNLIQRDNAVEIIKLVAIVLVAFVGVAYFGASLRPNLTKDMLGKPRVVQFYEHTRQAWAAGQLAQLSPTYQSVTSSTPIESIAEQFPVMAEDALFILFTKWLPHDDEYLIVVGKSQFTEFVLTNQRMILFDNVSKRFAEILLATVAETTMPDATSHFMVFKLKSGETVRCLVGLYPLPNYLDMAIGLARNSQDTEAFLR